MPIKLIALDMDGTLLSSDHVTVSARNLSALKAAADLGVKIAVASGRSWSLVREIVEHLGCVSYAVTANGANIRDVKTGATLGQTGMDREQSKAIVRILHKYHLSYELYIDSETYVERSDAEGVRAIGFPPEFIDVFLRAVYLTDDMLAEIDKGTPEKFDIFYVDRLQRPNVLAELKATGPFAQADALADNLELSALAANKGAALSALCAKLGIAAEEVMAFGDADNDPEMLAWAGWSFAMANGTERAKAAAKYLAPANTESGVGQMVEKYILE